MSKWQLGTSALIFPHSLHFRALLFMPIFPPYVPKIWKNMAMFKGLLDFLHVCSEWVISSGKIEEYVAVHQEHFLLSSTLSLIILPQLYFQPHPLRKIWLIVQRQTVMLYMPDEWRFANLSLISRHTVPVWFFFSPQIQKHEYNIKKKKKKRHIQI